jgi:hypothetical protein
VFDHANNLPHNPRFVKEFFKKKKSFFLAWRLLTSKNRANPLKGKKIPFIGENFSCDKMAHFGQPNL